MLQQLAEVEGVTVGWFGQVQEQVAGLGEQVAGVGEGLGQLGQAQYRMWLQRHDQQRNGYSSNATTACKV